MILFLIIFIAMLISPASAQPRAPIEWGPMEVVRLSTPDYGPTWISAKGDSIGVMAVRSFPLEDYPAASLSVNGGQTWSPWHVFAFPEPRGNDYWIWVLFTSQEILCCTQTQNDMYGFFRTTDEGWTWQLPPATIAGLRPQVMRGDTIFCRARFRGVTWTADGGRTFAPVREIEIDPDLPGVSEFTVSGESIHAITVGRDSIGALLSLFYWRGPRVSGPFEPGREINTEIWSTQDAGIDFDEEGNGVIVSVVHWAPPGFRLGAIVLNTSHDDGVNWSPPETLTPSESAGWEINVEHNGRFWLVTWPDTVPDPGCRWPWYRYVFSANHARSWYPSRQMRDTTTGNIEIVQIEFLSEVVRVYASGGDYFRWQGQIHRDSLPPFLSFAVHLPDTLSGDTAVEFTAEGSDSDSLWQMQVVLRAAGREDSTLLGLVVGEDSVYRATWVVPNDTAEWLYYYRAEDMWENVSFMPPEGPASPWTLHVGPLLARRESSVHPSSFSVSVFPNPSNGVIVIEGAAEGHQRLTIRVCDLLGREVTRFPAVVGAAGQFRALWSLEDESGRRVPAGSYFIQFDFPTSPRFARVVVIN